MSPFTAPTIKRSFLLFVLVSLFSLSAHSQDSVPVQVVLPKQSGIAQTLKLSGSLTAEKHSLLSPRVDGLVERVNVDAGSRVKQGEILLKLDAAIARQQVSQAKASVEEALAARDEATRLVVEAERLRTQNHISESELAKRKASLALQSALLSAAKAALATSEENLNRHHLLAPFSGVISNKLTEAGEWVNRGDGVLELVNLDVVRLDVMVPQERFVDISEKTPVVITPDTYPQMKLDAAIKAIVPVSDPQARAFLVRVEVEQQAKALLPGTSATAEFGLLAGNQQKLLIPRDALLLHPDGGYSVFVVKDGLATRKQVDIDQFSDEGVSIINGLDIEDAVVVRGNEVLRDQQAVIIKP